MPKRKYGIRLRNVRTRDPNDALSEELIRGAVATMADLPENVSKSLNIALAEQCDKMTATVSPFTKRQLKKLSKASYTGGTQKLPIEVEDIDRDFLGLTVLKNPDGADVDVCAVHGLQGHAFQTWMADNEMDAKRVLWLSDLLPTSQGFDKARIMVFGYTSKPLDRRRANDRLRDYAKSLLEELQFVRKEQNQASRPLILVCHSMGGLVSRLAVIQLKDTPETYPGMTPGQCGLLFLSTPHFGSKEADLDLFLRLVGKAIGVRKNLINDLRSLNIGVVDNQGDWKAMAEKPVVRCLVEAEKTRINFFTKRLIVEPASAGFFDQPADKILGTDHRSVCKFATSLAGYRTVADRLIQIRSDLMSRGTTSKATSQHGVQKSTRKLSGISRTCHFIQKEAKSIAFDTVEEHSKLLELTLDRLRSLNTMRIEQHIQEISDPGGDTFKWVLETTGYTSILKRKTCQIFQISGKPGCGKSVLAKFIYHSIEEKTGPDPVFPIQKSLLFAYNAQDDGRRTSLNALSSIIAQLLEPDKMLAPELETRLKDLSSINPWTFEHLRPLFLSLLSHPGGQFQVGSKLVLVLDALDECNDGAHRKQLLELLQRSVEICQKGCLYISLILTGRQCSDVSFQRYVIKPMALNLNTETALDRDLNEFIQQEVDQLIQGRPGFGKVRDEIVTKLQIRAGKMFLLVKLLVALLAELSDSSPPSIQRELEELPRTLSAIYCEIWSRSQAPKRERSKMIFSWLLYALRPLTVKELALAIATYDQQAAWDKQRERQSHLRTDLCSIESFLPVDLKGDLEKMFGPLVQIHDPDEEDLNSQLVYDNSLAADGDASPAHEDSSPATIDSLRAEDNPLAKEISSETISPHPIQTSGQLVPDDLPALALWKRSRNRRVPSFSTRQLEPRVNLCHQTVKEHFTKEPAFLDPAKTHIEMARICARIQDGTFAGDSDSKSIDTNKNFTFDKLDEQKNYSQNWLNHRELAVSMNPTLRGTVRLRRNKY